MKNEALYQKTVDILLDAYNEGTLEHSNCYACAVGNIVAANTGRKIIRKEEKNALVFFKRKLCWEGFPQYGEQYDDTPEEKKIENRWHHATIDSVKSNDTIRKEVEATGYSLEEIMMIEKAFEDAFVEAASRSNYEHRTNVAGIGALAAVIRTLGKIHETKEEDTIKNIDRLEGINSKISSKCTLQNTSQ